MSFTGTPLIMMAMFFWSKPRTLMRASPAPPPPIVAYTLGVTFITMGRSCEPSWF